MSEHPTIPQIVRALTTLSDRHQAEIRKVRADYVEKLHKLQERANLANEPELPPLKDGEYFHFEYVEWNPIEDGGYYSNKVEIANTREKALSKLRELIGSDYVYAVHVRRFPMKEQGVNIFDERKLPKSQSNAYMQRLRADKLDKAYEELRTSKMKMEDEYERSSQRQEDDLRARDVVIDILLGHIEATHRKLGRDNVNCVVSEPLEYLNLLVPAHTRPGEEWTRTLLRKALKEVRKRREISETDPADTDPSVCRYACTHPVANHNEELGCTHLGCACRYKGGQDEAVECDCGMTWPTGKMGPGHGDMWCQGVEPLCAVEGCGHPEERHTTSLPEEGSEEYCAECDGSVSYHDFKSQQEEPRG
jgi:hypothetical protein